MSVPKHVRRVRPRAYSVAVYLVVGIILLQVAMIISVFWLRAMVVTVNVHLPRPKAGQGAPQPLIGPEVPKITKPEVPMLPSLEATVPRPALLSVPTISDPLEQIVNLNDEAEVFMRQHALESAAETLLRAEDIDPRNPDTLKNLAETYNLMNDPIRSKIYWQRLVDLGAGVGTIYAVARDHVLLLDSSPNADILKGASNLPRGVYVDSVEKTPVETRSGQGQFHLRAILKRQDSLVPLFDQKKLQPYVIFYQQMSDGNLMPDLGQRKGSFEDTFLFWGDKKTEALGVDYIMPVPGVNDATVGKYYGFIIGIYYDKVLQDCRSEPSDLVNRLPLPQVIQ